MLPLVDMPVDTLLTFAVAVRCHPSSDRKRIAEFAGFAESTAKKALPALTSLGLIERQDGVWKSDNKHLYRGLSTANGRLVIRKALQSFRPFEAICEGLALGESLGEALRKARVLLHLSEDDSPALNVLVRWGRELGVFIGSNGHTALNPDLWEASRSLPHSLRSEDVESEAKARLYNARQLGRNANNYLDEVDRTLLAEAVVSQAIDPRTAVEKAGQAYEDFLRHVATDKGFETEARACNGITQLAAKCVSLNLLHSHHANLSNSIGTLRNAKAHLKDKATLDPWEITPLAASASLIAVLVAIRSIYEFVFEGKQTL